jgi:hypothetical protein
MIKAEADGIHSSTLFQDSVALQSHEMGRCLLSERSQRNGQSANAYYFK